MQFSPAKATARSKAVVLLLLFIHGIMYFPLFVFGLCFIKQIIVSFLVFQLLFSICIS